MHRRRTLGGIALAAGWLALQPRLAWSLARDKPEHVLARRLVDVFRPRQSAAAIGRAYLRTLAETPRVEGMLRTVIGGLEMSAHELHHARRSELRQTLSARIRQDFAESRTVRVDGWMLSLTEAELCGLAALLSA